MSLPTPAARRDTRRPPRHGLSSRERTDPIGYAVAALNRLAQTSALDRLGLRRPAERVVFEATRAGFRTAGAVSRQFARAGRIGSGPARLPHAPATGRFDLTPTEDEQLLLDVVRAFADEVVRPAAAAADDATAAPAEVLRAGRQIGLPLIGVPEELGGIATERSTMAATLVAEALARGDMGLAVASLAPGAVATALSLWGDEEQQATYLPAFTGDDVPAAALALTEPAVLFDPLRPATRARPDGAGFVLDGVKSMVPRGAAAELFVVGAELDGEPRLFLVESGTPGVEIEAEPSMGLRAAELTRLVLRGVHVSGSSLLGSREDHLECVRLARLGWCALAVGTAQAVLDHVVPYVNERHAFGEPISNRQAVAFMVADIGIELQGMRLVTYRAASRAGRGRSVGREVALARRLCAERGMKIGSDGVQLLGGHGFVKEHPVERWYRDLRAIAVIEGGVLV
ncbi:acyl-CoA dehydrogenase family protein [Nocardioides mesophilus]|uniref:Acyl-CoA dehydrogenase family protein n=1 Tax=Nocardioides mesophilus TaxID=433659 RepID=A0A7G9RB71_9ACTN|nr:acyl-CoA dehydrogenase family protein [Nocardioides mesophilus]QNN52846.1 acyl-CoA dehydrogenase family protein [Nocardioides mesophilus]